MSRIRSAVVVCAMSWGIAGAATAVVHVWDIGEVFSNADGTIQFIELFNPTVNSTEWFFKSVSTKLILDDETPEVFNFPSDLNSSMSTSLASALLGTAGFAAVAGVTPDWIIPDGFIPLGGGTATLNASGFGNFETLTFGALPTGLDSLNFDQAGNSSTALNSPMNFAGDTGVVPEPSTALLLATGLAALGRRRRRRTL